MSSGFNFGRRARGGGGGGGGGGGDYPLPSWMTTQGEWAAIPGANWGTAGVAGNGTFAFSGMTVTQLGCWKSGAFRSGIFLLHHGGGHTDSSDNGVYALGPLNESSFGNWFTVRAATAPAPINVARDGSNNPVSSHTYDGLQVDPIRNEMVRVPVGSEYDSGNPRAAADVFRLNNDPSGQPWYPADTGIAPGVGGYNNVGDNALSIVDPGNGDVLAWGKATPTYLLRKASGASSWDHWLLAEGIGGAGKMAYDPVRKIAMYVLPPTPTVVMFDLRSLPSVGSSYTGRYTPTTTGESITTEAVVGSCVYDPDGDQFIYWQNATKKLHFIKAPATNPYAGGNAWTVTSSTPTGGLTPPTYSAHSYYGRFNLIRGAGWRAVVFHGAAGDLYWRL